MSNFYKLVNENEYVKFNEEFFENIHGKLNTSVDINGSTINLEWFDFIYGVCPYINKIFEDIQERLGNIETSINNLINRVSTIEERLESATNHFSYRKTKIKK